MHNDFVNTSCATKVLETTAGGAWAHGAGLDGESAEQRTVRRAACGTLVTLNLELWTLNPEPLTLNPEH